MMLSDPQVTSALWEPICKGRSAAGCIAIESKYQTIFMSLCVCARPSCSQLRTVCMQVFNMLSAGQGGALVQPPPAGQRRPQPPRARQ